MNDNLNEIITLPIISILCYLVVEGAKMFTNKNSKVKKLLPIISAFTGAILGILIYLYMPENIPSDNVVGAALIGIISGLGATGSNQLIKHVVEFISKGTVEIVSNQTNEIDDDKYDPFPCISRDACNRVNCIDCPVMQNEKDN